MDFVDKSKYMEYMKILNENIKNSVIEADQSDSWATENQERRDCMHEFIEKSIRGGFSMRTTQHAKANNPLSPESFNMVEAITYLMYLDANNLYGWPMSQPLQIGQFRWLTEEEIATRFPTTNFKETVTALNSPADTWYIFEVYLKYPHHLHDEHSDYPLTPENIEITPDMEANFPKDTRKLTPNLNDKPMYRVFQKNPTP